MRKLKLFIAKAVRIFVGISTALVLSFPAGISLPTTATGITVTGYVYKDATMTPYAGVNVQIHTQDFSNNCWATTDPSGKYVISGTELCKGLLTAGSNYVLEANAPFNNTEGLLAPGPRMNTSITDGTNNMEPIIFTKAAKTLKGYVKKKDGAAVTGAMVNANKMGMPAFANAQTDSAGAFTLMISGGTWMVNINPMMGPGQPAADWVYFEQPQQISFNDNTDAETKEVNFTVTNASATVTGTVVDGAGNPISNGHVDVRSQDGRGNGQPLMNGAFTIKVPAGGYDVMVNTGDMSGSKYSIPRQHIDIADGQTITLNLVAKEKTAKITGRVVKNGVGVKNVQLNANQITNTPGAPGDWTMSQTDETGAFTLFVTSGRWHVNINQGPTQGPGGPESAPSFVYDGPPLEVTVTSDTDTANIGDISITSTDVAITGKVGIDSDGNGTIDEILNNFPGYAFARPKGAGGPNQPGPFREYGGPVNMGQFTIQIASGGVEQEMILGMHTPPDSDYAPAAEQTVKVVPNTPINQNIVLVKNNSKVWGRVLDSSGFPLSSCNFRGDAFLNNFQNGVWRGTQIKSDCSYSISVTPGTYQFGYNFDESAGFMNRPPSPDPIEIKAGDSIERNIKVVSGDATITGKVLDPEGNPVPNVFIFADNHEEIDQFRNESGEGPKGPPMGGQPGKPEMKQGEPRELKGLEKTGPGGAQNPKEIFDFCKDKKNEKQCKEFKLPAGSKGPGGCTTAMECTNYCKTHKEECFGQEATMKPPTGGTPGEFMGPGGCKSETECKAFCSKAENYEECHKFGPPPGGEEMMQLPNSMKTLTAADTKFSSAKGPDDVFDKIINSGAQTDANGNFTIKTLSGHKYSVGAGLPPESKFLPAKMQTADLTNSKSAFVTMQLRKADAKISGKVLKEGKLAEQGFVHAWAEDGGFSGSPVMNGTYSLNLTRGTVWHIGADSPSGRELYRSEEISITVDKDKSINRNFNLVKSNFVVPSPVSETFNADETKVISLEDGTSITIPSGAIDNEGEVTVTATPTVDLNSNKTAKPVGVGYDLEARDSSGNVVKKFNSNVTVKFSYEDSQLEQAGLNEESINPSFYDSSSNSWEKVTSATQDSDDNTISIQTDHFSAYALTDASGKARGKSTKQISAGKNKSGVATVAIGTGKTAKTITPFAGYKGSIQAKTANLGGKTGQVIIIAPSEKTAGAAEVKVYNTKGKKVKSFKPFGESYKAGVNIVFDDITSDGKEDLAMAPTDGNAEVNVYDFAKNKTRNVSLGSKGAVMIDSLEAFNKGAGALTAVTVSGNKTDIKVFKYNSKKGTFDWQQSFDTAKRISVSSGEISLVTPKPKINNLAPKKISYSADAAKTVKVNAPGENFAKDTTVLIGGTIPAVVKYKNDKLLELTITPNKLKKGKTYDIVVVGTDGAKTTAKKALTVK
ncbi:carboxypeptidase regulatory-like domain-containing protein [Patescibacteria group bacterium]|nr:MAG: carboxypeptidase regulatory-like domain-containing protein [Patescibacteria group bacterium]